MLMLLEDLPVQVGFCLEVIRQQRKFEPGVFRNHAHGCTVVAVLGEDLFCALESKLFPRGRGHLASISIQVPISGLLWLAPLAASG